jgi:hypothetical protein
VEEAPALGPFELLRRVDADVPSLYRAALRLPDVAPATDGVPDSAVDHRRWVVVFNSLRSVLGPHDIYWAVFDPTELEQPVTGSIAEDLADTYRDLMNGLALLDAGAPVADVLWTWRFSFGNHWGRHVLGALQVTHWLIHDDRVLPPDARSPPAG